MSKKDKQEMMAIPWVTEETIRHKKMPDELSGELLRLAGKYGIGGLLSGVSILLGRARSVSGVLPLYKMGQEIHSFVVEVNDAFQNAQLDKEGERSPLVHAVKSKLIN